MSFDLAALLKSNNTFEGKKSYEHVVVLLYRHWFVLLIKGLAYLLLALLPLIVSVVFQSTLNRWGITDFFWFLVIVYYMVWWNSLFYALTMYLLDIWIVTDHRVIDSQQYGFFTRTVAELSLSKIQDISVAIRGGIPTFLDFGDLEIQTAGTDRKFLFEQIPHPTRVKDIIMEAHYEYMSTHKDDIEIHEEVGMN